MPQYDPDKMVSLVSQLRMNVDRLKNRRHKKEPARGPALTLGFHQIEDRFSRRPCWFSTLPTPCRPDRGPG